jgi:glutamine cyclotransferase
VWIFNRRDDLIRIDSRTSTVTLRVHIRGLVSSGAALASGDGRLWLATTSYRGGQADVLAIDPVNGHATGRLNLGGTCYSENPATNAPIITYGAGHLWVSCWSVGDARRIVRIDPATGRVDAKTGVIPGSGSEWIVAGQQGTWYSTDTTKITKVDPSGILLTRVTVSDAWFPFSLGAAQLALGGGALWALAASDETIAKIDPATGRVTRLYQDYDPSNSFGAATFAIGFGSLWVEGARLLRLSMRTGRVQARLGPAGGGDSLAISNDAVWIGTQSGVLRIDPARLPG